jgi:hypothetical protein
MEVDPMRKFLVSAATYLVANAIGLIVALLLLASFSIPLLGFVLAVLIFTIVQVVTMPLASKLSREYVPQLAGGVSLVVIFIGLLVTSWIVDGMTLGGLANWLAATLIVWIASLVAQIALPIFVFREKDGQAAE